MRTHCTGNLAALTHWLTPQVWKHAHQAHQPRPAAHRWNLHSLVMVAALMTWATGDSEAERFAAARAFYVARHQREKRPGQSLPGFHKALAKLPMPVLHALFGAVRHRLLQLYERFWSTGGFVVFACDGSRLACPRSRELEKQLGCCSKPGSAPMLYVTTLVLLPVGLLWSWCVGPGTASELMQLQQLLPTLPRCALLVGDAYYLSYDLYAAILKANASFLIRMSSKAHLYTDQQKSLTHFHQGLVWYWPGEAQRQGRPPLRLRLIRVRGKKGNDVWLLTNVLESERLSRQQADEIYRWRWRSEGVFRTYKRTLPKLKLWSRTEALVYREAEVSLLALQLLLVQGIRCRSGTLAMIHGPRQILLRLRGDITTTIGTRLGPRQLRQYRLQLERIRRGGPGKKRRRKWPQRRDHKPPKPPHLRVLPAGLKAKMDEYFNAA